MKRLISVPPAPRFLMAMASLALAATAAAQQPVRHFHASHYEVDAILNPANQTLFAKVQADFVADEVSRDLLVELNPNLRITSIQMNGQTVPYLRSTDQPLDVAITLPDAVPMGQKVTLSFDYSGPLATDEESPSQGARLAYIGKDSAYLLLASRWFPLVSYTGQRYSAIYHLTVPGDFAVVGSGTTSAPDTVPQPPEVKPANAAAPPAGQPAAPAAPTEQWLRYTFTADQPAMTGTFVAGALELSPESVSGVPISVYTQPKDKGTAAVYAQSLANVIAFFSSEFGPLPDHNLTLAQLPPSAPMNSVSAPGLLLVNLRQWAEKPDEQLLAQLAAQQWWNGVVEPASANDVWLSDGLSRYSAVLYAEHTDGEGGLRRAVDSCAVGALMDEGAAPIGQAASLAPYTTAYNSVVVDKGAMVFHMLRSSIGNDAFLALLHTYLREYSGKTATIDEFQQLTSSVIAAAPAAASAPGDEPPPTLNAIAFFSQWITSTGIPDFSLEYIVYRTQKGFKVVGKVKQNLTTLNMPIQIRIETEGNPVTKTVQVVGDSTEFSIDTFGEPKPNGIILDPSNNVLKSTPSLRVRAMIALGEALAEQGQFFQAIQQYQKALDIQHQNGLALFRMGEAMFYQKNYQAAANSFRDSLDGRIDPGFKWVEVWDHIYLGKIYDLIGQRERAMNEYQKALETRDDTGGALEQAREYMQKPFTPPVDKAGS